MDISDEKEEEISCMKCGRIYKTQIGFQKHTCKPMTTLVTKRKLTVKEQLYHDIISDRKYYKLDEMESEELHDFIDVLINNEPGILTVNKESKRKNVSNLYLTAYNEAIKRVGK